VIAAFGAAITTAVDAWQRDGGKRDLLQLVDRAIDALADGMRERQSHDAAGAGRRASSRHGSRARRPRGR
jgi:hypothetical protein